MNICKIAIVNFRGVKSAKILLDGNNVFVGDNNSGKSTIFEAIDLVMGPDRLARSPVIDENDFYAGEYIKDGIPIEINIEVTIIGLNDEQTRYFANYIEWWNTESKSMIEGPPASSTDADGVVPALRLSFKGSYDIEEDYFVGQTYFSISLKENSQSEVFRKKDKRKCGFLYLRTLRTGSRALSLEHGSLLDNILQMKEMRPQIWENVISQLKKVSVASNPELGISNILESVQSSLKSLVPFETADNPQIKVSSLTREHLRKVLTVFMSSTVCAGDGSEYFTPYYHQGTGTINTLVLSLLTMIADEKENVIFAMEEPEIALPPHVQKRIVLSVIEKSTQALFTSHSPYVLEEFLPENILVVSRKEGEMKAVPAGMPPTVKKKQYRDELKRRFCESLLSRRVLITEGKTELGVYPAAARKLQKAHRDRSLAFELLGISLVNAETDTQIASLGEYYQKLNKTVYAVFDHQEEDAHNKIISVVNYPYEASEHGIENVILKGADYAALLRYGLQLVNSGEWPPHLMKRTPTDSMTSDELQQTLSEFFRWSKGQETLADFIAFCDEDEMPSFVKETIFSISETVYPLTNATERVDEVEQTDSVDRVDNIE